MNNFQFHSPTQFVFGRDTEKETGSLAVKYGAKNVLVIYGGGSARKSGLLDRVESSLTDAGLSFVELGGVQPNPTDDKVYEGIQLARNENVDFIVAVGGGSVIDTAKAIGVGVRYDGDFWDFYCGKKQVDNVHTAETIVPVAVVLTIPAAGSEGSGNSVITKQDGLLKLSFRTDYLMKPKFSIMNPELTYTLPPYQTACGIADMMVHVMERYFTNTQGVEITDRLCEAVLKAVINEGTKVIAEPENYDARANIMWSGTVAHNGLCGLGREEEWTSHFMEHEISAVYNVAHGAGLSVVVPAWLTYVMQQNPTKVQQFAERVMDAKTAEEGISKLNAFWTSIGLPVTMKELGIENPDIDLLVEKLHKNKGEEIGFYVKLDRKATREIYEMAK